MDFKRLPRLVATLWWLIAVVAVAGSATAFFVTRWQNSKIEERWEATAPVLILKTNSESDADYESRLRVAENRARLAVEALLSEKGHGYAVMADADQGRLEFNAADPDPTNAQDLAEGLRAAYLAAEPSDGIVEQLTQQLDDIEVQVLALRQKKGALVANTPVDPSVAAQLSLMESQLSTLRQKAAQLSLALSFPELGTAVDDEGNAIPPATIRADLATTKDVIARLQEKYDNLSAANPEPTASASDDEQNLQVLVIDQQIRDLESEYVDTALSIEELKGGGTTSVLANTTEVVNTTPGAASPTSAGLLGLGVGAVLATGLIIGTDKMRRAILGIEDDLALPILATVDQSRPGAEPDRAWYLSATGRRRSDVQVMRSALDGLMGRGPVTIGLSGLGAADGLVQALAADLATSVAASGREVFLVDTVFESPSNLPEYTGSGPSLADIVAPAGAAASRTELKPLLADRDYVAPEMRALPAGSLDDDPVDAVAGRRFREVLDVAGELAEVTIVASPHWGFPQAEVLAQRLDYFVLVGRVGVTTAVDLETAAGELAMRSATPVGLVLLVGRSVGLVVLGARGPLGVGPSRRRRRPAPVVIDEVALHEDLADRRHGVELQGLGLDEKVALDGPAAVGSPAPHAPPEPDQAERSAEATRALEAFLAERVDALVAHGIDREVIAGQPPGALLMLPDRYPEGATAVLHADLLNHVPNRVGEIEQAVRRLVGSNSRGREPDDFLDALNRWLNRRLIEFEGKSASGNQVWHITSALGTFQALVNAATFDAARLAKLRSAAVDPLLEQLMRREMLELINEKDGVPSSRVKGRPSSVRAQIDDVQRFHSATHDLCDATNGGVFTWQQLYDADLLSPRHWTRK